MPAWYSAADGAAQTRLVGAWPGAPVDNEELCGFILDVARRQVLEFGPDLGITTEYEVDEEGYVRVITEENPPSNFVLAQRQHAMNLWAAGRADENGDIGTEGFSFVPRPLDKTIRNIIRPVQGGIGGGL